MKLSEHALLLVILAFSAPSFSVTYIPVPIERQVKEAKGVVQATIIQSSAKRISTGQIVTEYWANLERYSGSHDLANSKTFSFLVPGGKLESEGSYIPGGPEFKTGEKVLVFIKTNREGNWLQNLGVGKYNVKNIGDKTIFVSSVFPFHPTMGQIEEGELNRILRSHWGAGLVTTVKLPDVKNVVNHDTEALRDLPSEKKRLNRKIASIDEIEEASDADESKWGVFWLLSLLAVLGGLTQVMSKRKGSRHL